MEDKKYIYLAETFDCEDFRFSKGTVYVENEKIKEKIEKFPLLKKILVDVEELPTTEKNERLFETVVAEIREQINGGN